MLISVGAFCEFVIGARCVHFTVPSGRTGTVFFLRGQMYKFGSTFIKKIWAFVYHCITMPRLVMNWEKIQARNLTVLWCLYSDQVALCSSFFSLVSMNVSEQSFPYKVFKISSYIFWVWLLILFQHLLCKQMTVDFMSGWF